MTEKHVDSWELLINLEFAFFFFFLPLGHIAMLGSNLLINLYLSLLSGC